MRYVLILSCLFLMALPFQAVAESVRDKHKARTAPQKAQTTTTTTKGYVTRNNAKGDAYVDLKTVTKPDGTSTTTGYVDGKYVKVKSKTKDRKD